MVSLSGLLLSILLTVSSLTVAKGVLNFIVFAPYPDSDYHPSFDMGHSIVPAVLLARDHINNDSDILPNLEVNLVIQDTGCDKPSKTAVDIINFIRKLLVTRIGPLAIIGPVCSEDSIFVTRTFNVNSQWPIPVLYSGTTPNLSTHFDKRPNIFGMISSAEVLIEALISIADRERWSWKNVAVFYDDYREHFHHIYDAFIRAVNGSQNVGYVRQITSSQIPLSEVIKRNIRILVLLSDKEPAQQIVCLAGQSTSDFVFPIHQFIFIERSLDDFVEVFQNGFTFEEQSSLETYHCNEETMLRGLNGTVFIDQALDAVAPEAVTVSGYTAREVKAEYKKRLAEYGEEINMSLPSTPYAYPYYDATWAAAIALHHFFHGPDQPKTFPLLSQKLRNVSFQGVSSWIDFDNYQHVTNNVNIYQVNGTTVSVRGLWNGSRLTYAPDTFISDTFKMENVVLHDLLVAIGFITAIVLCLSTVILQAMTIAYRNYSSVKASSVQLNHFIYLGCYLYIVTIMTNTLRQILPSVQGTVLCNIDTFSALYASCFICSTVLVKSWRTYRIFNHVFKTARGHRYSLHSLTLATFVISLTLLQVLFCVPVLVLSPFEEIKSFVLDSSKWPPIKRTQSVCIMRSVGYIAIPLLFQLCLMLATVFLATLNRNVKRKHFRTTKHIFVLIYILTIMWAVGGTLLVMSYYFNFSVNITYSLYLALISITVILSQVMLIAPSLSPVFTGRGGNTFSLYIRSIRHSVLI